MEICEADTIQCSCGGNRRRYLFSYRKNRFKEVTDHDEVYREVLQNADIFYEEVFERIGVRSYADREKRT